MKVDFDKVLAIFEEWSPLIPKKWLKKYAPGTNQPFHHGYTVNPDGTIQTEDVNSAYLCETCGKCGFHDDECVCMHNEIMTALNKLLEEEIDSRFRDVPYQC